MNNNRTEMALDEVSAPQELHLPSHRGRRWVLRILGIVVVLAAIAFFLQAKNGNGKPQAIQYKTEAASRGNLVVTVSATGNLEPTNQVQVGSEQSGSVESVAVDCNDHVTVGQVLAQLDTTRIKAQIQQQQAALESARADVLSAQATVAETRGELARLTDLRKISDSKGVSQRDLDAAQAAVARAAAAEAKAKAAVSQAQAALEAGQTDLAKMTIHSPINGVVLTRSVDPGQTVAASLQAPELFLLAEDLAKMQLNVDVDEADVGLVQTGQDATFTVDAYPDRKFPAKIRRVSYGSATTGGVVTYETVLDVDNSDLTLRPGMTATATIVVKKIENAVLIPNTALRFTPPQEAMAGAETQSSGESLVSKILPHPPRAPAKTKNGSAKDTSQPVVWTLHGGQLTAVPVKLGSSDGSMTEILEGDVSPGMELVVDTIKAAK